MHLLHAAFEAWDWNKVKTYMEIATATTTLEDMKRCTDLKLISIKNRIAGKVKSSGSFSPVAGSRAEPVGAVYRNVQEDRIGQPAADW